MTRLTFAVRQNRTMQNLRRSLVEVTGRVVSRCQPFFVLSLIFGLDIRPSSKSLIAYIFLGLFVVANGVRVYVAVIRCVEFLRPPAGFTDLTLAVGQLTTVALR